MNIEELHLKKAWDAEILKKGPLQVFCDIYNSEEREEFKKWLNIYFKDLEIEMKYALVQYASYDIINNIKDIVDETEYKSMFAYNYIINNDLMNIRRDMMLKDEHTTGSINEMKMHLEGRILFLESELMSLRNEIAELRSKN